jgi:hypothetical protein
MAYTQADLTAIDKAIAGGKLTVQHGETSVTYRSMDEMLKIRALIIKDVNPVPRRRVATYRSGF